MAKRNATTDINHENWDQDYEPEEAGTFQKAPEDELKKRVFKTAKRRNLTDQGGGKTSAFSAFAGFSKQQAPPSSSTFSFLSNITPKMAEKKSDDTSPVFKLCHIPQPKYSELEEYYKKLKGLNVAVTNFIKLQVDANPLINLMPVFDDYNKYMKELDTLRNKLTDSMPYIRAYYDENDEECRSSEPPPRKSFSPERYKTIPDPINEWMKVKYKQSSFPFGATDLTKKPSEDASFGATSVAPSTSATDDKPAETEKTEDDAEDSEPPKPDFTPVVEEGHIYTTRCKVFVKKDGTYIDRGVGNLFLKPVPANEKVQLIVRADTSLGNILCNFILSSSIPMQRLGKKDVMLVCIPTPETKPPPVSILLRVKTEQEADLLFETLQKHKK